MPATIAKAAALAVLCLVPLAATAQTPGGGKSERAMPESKGAPSEAKSERAMPDRTKDAPPAAAGTERAMPAPDKK